VFFFCVDLEIGSTEEEIIDIYCDYVGTEYILYICDITGDCL